MEGGLVRDTGGQKIPFERDEKIGSFFPLSKGEFEKKIEHFKSHLVFYIKGNPFQVDV